MITRRYPIYSRCYAFSLAVVKLAKDCPADMVSRNLVVQLVRAVTSITANLSEADAGISRKDFVNKVTIAVKEARETLYWLQLLTESGYIKPAVSQSLMQEGEEITKILAKIKINSRTSVS